MMLIGMYDSPFARRVAVALKIYGLSYRHEPWSTFGDAEKIARFNPLRRVPVLVMDDGVAHIDSAAILKVLDDLVGPENASLARSGREQHELLRLSAFAAGVADKALSLLYERALREATFPLWVERCRAQISETLDHLEDERSRRATPWLFGHALSHADVVLATMSRFVREALATEFDWSRWPALSDHSARCEALAAFREASQPFNLVRSSAP